MSVAARYAESIVRRAREPMEPLDFVPDWADQPRRHKVYPDVTRTPLPEGGAGAERPLGDCLGLGARPRDLPEEGRFTVASLAAMLRHSYGLLGRRLRVNGNDDNDRRPWLRTATWSRGTASGGGLYPCEVYWVCGTGGPLLPGVYHYSTPHHAVQRLLAGDVSGQVRDALGDRADGGTGQFLLVTVKFWKNAFKYNSFCYHVVTMDLGALLETWQLWATAEGVRLRPALWFDDEALDCLLGLDTLAESVMAVVPLPWTAPAARRLDAADGRPSPRVARREVERSAKVTRFPLVEQVHVATLVGAAPRPGPGRLASAAVHPPVRTPATPLPPLGPAPLAAGLARALRARRSSFGLFRGAPALSAAELGALLAAGGGGHQLRSDLRGASALQPSSNGDESPLTRLCVFVNHVDRLPPGAYDYDPARHAVAPVPGGPPGLFLQRHYFLDNYNLEQAAAVLVVLGRPAAVVAAIGDRGYRLLNAEVGAVAQAVYLAAAALGVGCGAALGFDNVAFAERLGVAGGDQWPLLLLMVGREHPDQADLDQRLL